MSIVYYKFKAAKKFDTVTFDGTSISVFDLKHEIMTSKKLGKGTDFDLVIYNAQTNEEYADDMFMIPRNSSILVARQPPARAGKGTAQRYVDHVVPPEALLPNPVHPLVGGEAPMSSGVHNPYALPLASSRAAPMVSSATTLESGKSDSAENISETAAEETEEEKMKRMFAQSESYWKQTEKKLEHARFIPYTGNRPVVKPTVAPGAPDAEAKDTKPASSQFSNFQPDYTPRPPPQGYICYRCGEKGHWIQQCPKATDPDYENKPKLKRTTGIPRTFLKVVEQSEAKNQNLLLTGTGELVMQVMHNDEWSKKAEQTRKLADDVLGTADSTNVPKELLCGICNRLLRDATGLPCCGAAFCEDCLKWWLIDNPNAELRLTCPKCKTPNQTPDKAFPLNPLREMASAFLNQKKAASVASGAATVPPPVQAAEQRSSSPIEVVATAAKPIARPVRVGGAAPSKLVNSKSKKLSFLTVRAKQ